MQHWSSGANRQSDVATLAIRLLAPPLLLLLCIPTPAVESPEIARHQASFRDQLELESRAILITFATVEAAGRASIRPLPLYRGADWAITSRWDDNSLAHLKTHAVLLEHGHRGTFFLNDPAQGLYGRDYGLAGKRPMGELGRFLATGGMSIGGHSLTHPFMSYQNRNRMFEEMLGCRIALESAFDLPVNAYAFSFGNFTSPIEGEAVERDITVMLARSGYLQVANHAITANGAWPWGIAGLLPADGRPIDRRFAAYLSDPDQRRDNPAIAFCMHSWYETAAEWAGFERELARYAGRPEWWYCNQNAYGAYRAQYRPASEGRTEVDGRQLLFRFERPVLIDLNDPIPLTFAITGVPPEAVLSITSPGASVERIDPAGDTARFHLHHAGDRSLPARIDHVEVETGRPTPSTEFTSISGLLRCEADHLQFELHNDGPEALHVGRLTCRLPPRFLRGVVRGDGFELAADGEQRMVVELGAVREDGRFRAGTDYFAVQVDFHDREGAGRIHFTTHRAGSFDDSSYPRQGFSVLGPIPRAQLNRVKLSATALCDGTWRAADGRTLTFEVVDPARAEPLNAEVIPVRGRWNSGDLQPSIYILRSTVEVMEPRDVRLLCDPATVTSVWLNGRRVIGETRLAGGGNELLLAYEPPHEQNSAAEHAGPMFRIVDARTGDRLREIRYRR